MSALKVAKPDAADSPIPTSARTLLEDWRMRLFNVTGRSHISGVLCDCVMLCLENRSVLYGLRYLCMYHLGMACDQYQAPVERVSSFCTGFFDTTVQEVTNRLEAMFLNDR
jgi:hypothetical protein